MPAYIKKVSLPGKTAKELYDVVSSDIERVMAKASVGGFEIERNPGACQVSIKSPMFSATLSCRDGELSLDGKLSLLATPFRSKIDDGIDRWLNKAFKTA